MKRLITATVFLSVLLIGAVRTEANPVVFVAHLSGPNEAPPNASPGSGFATITIDAAAHTLRVQVSFQDLTAGNTAAHIHATTAAPFTGTAGVATSVPTFTGFPTGATSGTYDFTFDTTMASSFNPAFVTAQGSLAAAEAALFAAINNGRAYVNIHTPNFPGGEIRGFLVPVPEPATMLLFGTGLAALAAKYRSKRNEKRTP